MPIIKTKEDLDRFIIGKLMEPQKPPIMPNTKIKINGNTEVKR